MAIYDVDGNELANAYDVDGNIIYQPGAGYPYLRNRILVFEDDFNGNQLDSSKWEYEIGYCRNSELQHYRPENVSVENGHAIITASKGHYPSNPYNWSTWTSGSITTMHKFSAFYGRWQARIKFPNKVGAFGAFWMLGDGLDSVYYDDGRTPSNVGPVRWTKCGEIDITETIPGNIKRALCNLWNYSTQTSFGNGSSPEIIPTDWNIYEIEWTEEHLVMMVNGIVYKTYDLSDEELKQYLLTTPNYQNGFYMILNLAVGASGGTPAEDLTEMKMMIDFVRVYAPENYTQNMIHANSITLDVSNLTMNTGDVHDFTVTWNPVNTYSRILTWISSDNAVCTVNSGRVKAIGTGTATITCTTDNGKTAQCVVAVIN